MANQSKQYLSVNLQSHSIFISLSQLFAASLLLVYLGNWIGSFCPRPRTFWQILIYLGSCLLLLVMVDEPVWNYFLAVVNSLVCGLVLCWSAARIDLLAIPYILGFLLGVITSSRRSGWNLIRPSRPIVLFVLLIFIAGSIVLPWIRIPLNEMRWWKIMGIGLFSVLLVFEIEGGRLVSRQEEILGLAVRIQIVIHNLYWLIISLG